MKWIAIQPGYSGARIMIRSYGENILEVNRQWNGKARVLGVRGQGSLYPRLLLSIGWTLQPIELREGEKAETHALELRQYTGELRLSEREDPLGIIHWAEPRNRAISSVYTNEGPTTAVCELDWLRLSRLEARRAGNALTLWVELAPTVVTESGRQVHAEIRPFSAQIPRDDWLRALKELGYGEREILEIPFPGLPGGIFALAANHVRQALISANSGEYGSALVNCRKAIEALEAIDKNTGLANALQAASDEKRHKEYMGIMSHLKQLGSLAAHNYGANSNFSRVEVLFVIRLTAGVAALVAELLTAANSTSLGE